MTYKDEARLRLALGVAFIALKKLADDGIENSRDPRTLLAKEALEAMSTHLDKK